MAGQQEITCGMAVSICESAAQLLHDQIPICAYESMPGDDDPLATPSHAMINLLAALKAQLQVIEARFGSDFKLSDIVGRLN